jgi:hypothetical protein
MDFQNPLHQILEMQTATQKQVPQQRGLEAQEEGECLAGGQGDIKEGDARGNPGLTPIWGKKDSTMH